MERSFRDELTFDPETGLPALPENLAWRVKIVGSQTLAVQLVRRIVEPRTFWQMLTGAEPTVEWDDFIGREISKSIDTYDYIYAESPTKKAVLQSATKIYQEIHEAYVRSADMDELVGIYPPKTIL